MKRGLDFLNLGARVLRKGGAVCWEGGSGINQEQQERKRGKKKKQLANIAGVLKKSLFLNFIKSVLCWQQYLESWQVHLDFPRGEHDRMKVKINF